MLRTVRFLLEYAGVRLVGWVAQILSLQAARAAGRRLGRFAFDVLKIRRGVTLQNLARAFPEKSEQEIDLLGRATYEQFGMMMLEYLRVPALQPSDILRLVQCDDHSPLDTALAGGKGGVLLTGHFGNWEYLGAWLSAKGYPVTYMFQNQANPYVGRLIRRYRERMGMQVVPRGIALREYLKALHSGRFVAALADQDSGRHGVFVEFLGRQASTPTGPARFALKTGAPIVFGVTVRDADGNLHARFESVPVAQKETAPSDALKETVAAYTRTLEKWILKYPDHWFWMHRRWKTPAPEQSPGEGGAHENLPQAAHRENQQVEAAE